MFTMEVTKIRFYNKITGWSVVMKKFGKKEVLKLDRLLKRLGFRRDLKIEKRALKLGIKAPNLANGYYSKGQDFCSYMFEKKGKIIAISWLSRNYDGEDLVSLYMSNS